MASKRKPQKQTSSMSYDTQVLIVVILLVAMYPVGVVVMWLWMRDWPLWLRLFITLPLLLGIVFCFFFFYVLGHALTSRYYDERSYRYRMHPPYNMPQTSPTTAPQTFNFNHTVTIG